MALGETISTGVDGFISLIRASGRIEINEAAVKLEVSRSVLEEWAQVLEEQGLVRIEYQLTKFYLVWTGTVTDAPAIIEAKRDRATDERASAIMLAEAQVQEITNIGLSLESLKRKFAEVNGAFEIKFGGVRTMIERLNELKRQREELLFQLNELGGGYDARSKALADETVRLSAESDELHNREAAIEQKIAVLKETVANIHAERLAPEAVEQRMAAALAQAEPLQKDFVELRTRSERIAVSLKKLKGSNEALARDIEKRKGELDRIKRSSDDQLVQVSDQLEEYLKEATTLVSEFESRIGIFEETEARLKKLSAEQDAVNADIMRILKELRDLNANKNKMPIADVFNRINAARDKVNALTAIKERQLREQAEVEALLKKAL